MKTKKPMTHAGTVQSRGKTYEVQLRETPTRWYEVCGHYWWPKEPKNYQDHTRVDQQGQGSNSYICRYLDLDSIRPLTVEERRTPLSDTERLLVRRAKKMEAEQAELQARMDQNLQALREARKQLRAFDLENFNQE